MGLRIRNAITQLQACAYLAVCGVSYSYAWGTPATLLLKLHPELGPASEKASQAKRRV
jgi:hypothetical protein